MKMITQWQDLPFKKYLEIVNLDFELDDLSNAIYLVSILTDKSIEEVEKMKAKEFTKYSSNLKFLESQPNSKNSKFDWQVKKIEDITMDDFIAFNNLKDDINNFPTMLSFMSLNNIIKDDINAMNTEDILNGFFLLNKQLKKYIVTTLLFLILKAMKGKIQKLAFWRKKSMR